MSWVAKVHDETRSESGSSTDRRFLIFVVNGSSFALPAEEVLEIIPVPGMTSVPQSPRALLGIGNLRGTVLPICSLSELLGNGKSEPARLSRAVVLDLDPPVAIAVDAVDALVSVPEARIQTRREELGHALGAHVQGMFSVSLESTPVKIIDISTMLADAFVQRPRAERKFATAEVEESAAIQAPEELVERLVTFDVAGQEFALDLASVHEIVSLPSTISAVPHADTPVLGVMALRDRLLPLLSLRKLLGLASVAMQGAREKVIVTAVSGASVGLVVDQTREVVTAGASDIDSLPPVLAARLGGESRLRGIYRAQGGGRIIGVLAPEQLFREDVMKRLNVTARQPGVDATPSPSAMDDELCVVVFRLGADEFALPIEAVQEIAHVPAEIRRVPKTPKFLAGVVNLRGSVLPVIDQRRRFDMPPPEQPLPGRRLIVTHSERHRAGLIVDGVSDVMRVPATSVKPAPALTEEITRLVRGVINLEQSGRILLLLDPAELLTRAERGLLDKFHGESAQAIV